MEDFWAHYLDPKGHLGPNYWEYFAERIIDLSAIPKGAAVLDVGTYDGNVLFKAMKKAGISGSGVGIDIYRGGFIEGVTEASLLELLNVDFIEMDAAFLGFPSETYDVVLGNFVGWDYCFDFSRMEFTSPDLRMAEIMRVLKPGGQVGLSFWIDQSDIEWIVETFSRYLPENDKLKDDPITSYGKENPEGYQVILRTGGFQNIQIHAETTSFTSPDTDTWWRQMRQAVSDYFQELPELEGFKEQVLKDVIQFQSIQGIHFNKTVGYAFGIKP